MVATVITEHIEITPGVRFGKPRVKGTRITVQDIAIWHERQALTPSQIVGEFPELTLADVHAALAYYHDHREAIDGAILRAEEVPVEPDASPVQLIERVGRLSVADGLANREH